MILSPVPVGSMPETTLPLPSRSGATLNALDSFGNMLLSNWSASSWACARVTVVEFATWARQSPAGNAVSSATQTSIFAPTACSVYDFL